jgi:hypothetical protein
VNWSDAPAVAGAVTTVTVMAVPPRFSVHPWLRGMLAA